MAIMSWAFSRPVPASATAVPAARRPAVVTATADRRTERRPAPVGRARAPSTGAVNRLGTSVPAANPSAVRAGRLAPATTAGHHSGPPQVAWRAVTPYTTAT